MNPLKELPITVAYVDSTRSRAYMQIFEQSGYKPRTVIYLGDPWKPPDDNFLAEVKAFNYAANYFDPFFDSDVFFKTNSIPVINLNTRDINSPDFAKALSTNTAEYCLFTGGGIIKAPLFSVGKKFIHVHPGIVPHFRGSTCFYYSIIEHGNAGATAFFMTEKLDEGKILVQKEFSIRNTLSPKQKYFMDYIFDAFIRGSTLKELLKAFADQEIVGLDQSEGDRQAYFVMHPLLRMLAITTYNKIGNAYRASTEENG